MQKYKKTTFETVLSLIKKHKIYALLVALFLLNIIQFAYFTYQNQQLSNRIANVDNSWRADSANTKKVVTNLSQYFEGKGNLTIEGLLATINQVQSDEAGMKTTIDTLSGTINTLNQNASVINNNAYIEKADYTHLQQELCYASNGYYCR